MKKYLLTSPTLEGEIIFGYNDSGLAMLYDNRTQSPDKQIVGLLKNFPFREQDLHAMVKGTGAILEEIFENLDFDTWWELQPLGKKINKARCKPLWAKMSDESKSKAIRQQKPYLQACGRTGRGIVDPENYLSKEYYNNDWRNVR